MDQSNPQVAKPEQLFHGVSASQPPLYLSLVIACLEIGQVLWDLYQHVVRYGTLIEVD